MPGVLGNARLGPQRLWAAGLARWRHASGRNGVGADSRNGRRASAIGRFGRQPCRSLAAAAAYTPSGLPADLPASTRVCILGGGFGGLYTAIRLQALLWPQGNKPKVTLVDRGERFVFKPLLYELVNGTAQLEEVAPSFVKLLGPYNVDFVQGSVQSIQPFELRDGRSPAGGRITLDAGAELEYDYLVLSLGSQAAAAPGAAGAAVEFNTVQDALQIQAAVEALRGQAASEVVVVGGGPTGVELASTIADRLGKRARVHLVSSGPEILKGSPPTHRAAAEATLARNGVSVIRSSLVTGVQADSQPGLTGLPRRTVDLKDSAGNARSLEADLVVWTAGSRPALKAQRGLRLPFPTTEAGAMRTEETLQVAGHPRVFALGDVASTSGSGPQDSAGLPATAQVAFQQADYAAWNIWAAVNSRPLLPFKYQHLGDMMTLGRADGAVTLPIALPRELTSALQSGPVGSLLQLAGIRLGSDGDRGVTVEGSLGALIRRAAYLYRQPTDEQRVAVGSQWLQRALDAGSEAVRGGRRGTAR